MNGVERNNNNNKKNNKNKTNDIKLSQRTLNQFIKKNVS
jgi:hypothetical protein